MNAEAYVLGVGVSGALNPVVAAVGVSVGQTIGKVAMFLAVRYRPGYAARKTKEPKPVDLDTRWGRFVHWNRDVSKRLLDAMSDRRWGIPVTLLSAFVGIPPLYGVAIIGGASRMGVLTFTLSVLAGRSRPLRPAWPSVSGCSKRRPQPRGQSPPDGVRPKIWRPNPSHLEQWTRRALARDGVAVRLSR